MKPTTKWNSEAVFFHLQCSLRATRALTGLSQDELAVLTGLTRQTIIRTKTRQLFSLFRPETFRAALQKIAFMLPTERSPSDPRWQQICWPLWQDPCAACGTLACLRQAELAVISRQMIMRSGRLGCPYARNRQSHSGVGDRRHRAAPLHCPRSHKEVSWIHDQNML
jgi:hypothetical protein